MFSTGDPKRDGIILGKRVGMEIKTTFPEQQICRSPQRGRLGARCKGSKCFDMVCDIAPVAFCLPWMDFAGTFGTLIYSFRTGTACSLTSWLVEFFKTFSRSILLVYSTCSRKGDFVVRELEGPRGQFEKFELRIVRSASFISSARRRGWVALDSLYWSFSRGRKSSSVLVPL